MPSCWPRYIGATSLIGMTPTSTGVSSLSVVASSTSAPPLHAVRPNIVAIATIDNCIDLWPFPKNLMRPTGIVMRSLDAYPLIRLNVSNGYRSAVPSRTQLGAAQRSPRLAQYFLQVRQPLVLIVRLQQPRLLYHQINLPNQIRFARPIRHHFFVANG